MDVIGDAVAAMRAGRPVSARLDWRAPWGQRFASVKGAAGVQIVLRGQPWLIRDDGVPLRLSAGDVLLMPRGRGYALADSPTTPLRPCTLEPGPSEIRALPGPTSRSAAATPSGPAATAGGSPAATTAGGSPAATTAGELEVATGDGMVLCGAYELEPARMHPLMYDLPELVHLPAHLERSPRLRAVVELLAAELESPADAARGEAGVPALVELMFLYVLRDWLSVSTGRGGWSDALRDPAVSAALRAIHLEPGRGWSVAELAAVSGVSRAVFARRFAGLVGRAPLAYVGWWRMTIAARMLRESDVPLRVVARRVGYASEFAFAAAFKRRFGTAPGRFRHQPSPDVSRRA